VNLEKSFQLDPIAHRQHLSEAQTMCILMMIDVRIVSGARAASNNSGDVGFLYFILFFPVGVVRRF